MKNFEQSNKNLNNFEKLYNESFSHKNGIIRIEKSMNRSKIDQAAPFSQIKRKFVKFLRKFRKFFSAGRKNSSENEKNRFYRFSHLFVFYIRFLHPFFTSAFYIRCSSLFTSAFAFDQNRILELNPIAVLRIVPFPAVPSQKADMRRIFRQASHPRRNRTGFAPVIATALADPSGPKSEPQIAPNVMNRTKSISPQKINIFFLFLFFIWVLAENP